MGIEPHPQGVEYPLDEHKKLWRVFEDMDVDGKAIEVEGAKNVSVKIVTDSLNFYQFPLHFFDSSPRQSLSM